ncbi:hypothetical protein [Haladaptatus sp. R4]|uniref:hypothetical protein n=1 Tax=Haladaptatus sp. R4 TaxID=1679489 RepID=UPI000A66F6F9|nr:hypothetical protein [Haladaptatus sp. R4]
MTLDFPEQICNRNGVLSIRTEYGRYAKRARLKVAISCVSLAIAFPLFAHIISIDSFAPQHVARVQQIVETGHIAGRDVYLSGFYSLGSIMTLLWGTKATPLLYTPLTIFPYIALYYALIKRVSGSYVVAGVLVLVQFLASLNGTSKTFYWPHGIGALLEFTILLLLFIEIERPTKRLYPVGLLAGSTLVFVSYDRTAIVLMTLVALWVTHPLDDDVERATVKRRIEKVVPVLLVVEFGFLNFVYLRFLPVFLGAGPSISSFDKLLLEWFKSDEQSKQLAGSLYFSQPPEVTYIALAKYVVIGLSLLFFVAMFYYHVVRDEPREDSILIHSFLVGIGGFIFIRFAMGHPAVAWLHPPAVLCIAYFWRLSDRSFPKLPKLPRVSLRKWSALALAVLLVTQPAFFVANQQHHTINRTDGYEDFDATSVWAMQYANVSEIRSSVLTKYLLQLYMEENTPQPAKNGASIQKISIANVGALRNGSALPAGYYAINYEWNWLALKNWVNLESWRRSKARIQANEHVDKVYQAEETTIYYSTNRTA